MHERFREIVDQLHDKYESLISMEPYQRDGLPKGMPKSGVYVFSEGSTHLYVGRTRRLRKRLLSHARQSVKDSPFAFRLAREETGSRPTYRAEGSRSELLQDPAFIQAYQDAKDRIGVMDIRFVEEVDPTSQALLEIYVATVLQAPYNDFNTH